MLTELLLSILSEKSATITIAIGGKRTFAHPCLAISNNQLGQAESSSIEVKFY